MPLSQEDFQAILSKKKNALEEKDATILQLQDQIQLLLNEVRKLQREVTALKKESEDSRKKERLALPQSNIDRYHDGNYPLKRLKENDSPQTPLENVELPQQAWESP
mgnify:CR=1 FL=1